MKNDNLIISCDECYGEGSMSSCCGENVYNGKCGVCGKFCKEEVCLECNGRGLIEYNINDDVEIFVCTFSSKSLKDQINYHPKKRGQFKTFKGKIKEIVDDKKIKVYIKYYKKEIIINPNEVELV